MQPRLCALVTFVFFTLCATDPGALAQRRRPADLKDSDEDGVADRDDACPLVSARTEDGCPDAEAMPEEEPVEAEEPELGDAPDDEEGLGEEELDEDRELVEGDPRVPKAPPPPTNRDGDEVPDSADKCPDAWGPAPDGCPVSVRTTSPPTPPSPPPSPVVSSKITIQVASQATRNERVGRVVTALKAMAGALEAMVKAAEGAKTCADLATTLNGWADGATGGQVPALLESLVLLGLLPAELQRAEVVAVDKRYKAAMERWMGIPVLAKCEADEAFQTGLSQDFAKVFGSLLPAVDEIALEPDDVAPIPVARELVEIMLAAHATADGVKNCSELTRRWNRWYDEHGKRFQALVEQTYTINYTLAEDEEPQAYVHAEGNIAMLYDELVFWFNDAFEDCTQDPSDPVTMRAGLEELDFPIYATKWGRDPNKWTDPKKSNPW